MRPLANGDWLVLDASATVATVAVFHGPVLLASRETPARAADRDLLMPAVVEALRDAGVRARALDGVACGGGPGSFTGLRMAAAVAKGFAMAAGCPLFSIPSLLLLGVSAPGPVGPCLAVLPAGRSESFVAEIGRDERGRPVIVSSALVPDAAVQALPGTPIVGPGRTLDLVPNARAARALLDTEYLGSPVDLDPWEPTYGRQAEAQVRWEAAHGRPLPTT